MSLTRRLAAGIPAAGVTVLAALAFAGSPAQATGDTAESAARPAVMATPCADDARTSCAGSADPDGYGGGQADDNDIPNDNATSPGAVDDDRGNPGYGSESPAPSPSETAPTGTTDTVPPGGGVSPATTPATPPADTETPPPGVSAGGTLPLTGAPLATTIGIGAALVIAGGAAVYVTRRRRIS
jgi:LPXTG-motif cell wall-anchored protein